jgi:hypothetical protein
VNRAPSIPFGPERKDPPWRWGSFLIGIASFVVLAWIATLGGVNLFGFWWIVAVVLGFFFSLRSGRAWSRGEMRDLDETRKVAPTVDVRGQAGSTYLLLEPAKVRGPKVRPREFGPFWWALYSLFVRAPVALGDFVLTSIWRFTGGFWNSSGSAARAWEIEQAAQVDYPSDLPDPDRERF